MSTNIKDSDFFRLRLETYDWYKASTKVVQMEVLNNDVVAAYLLDVAKNNSDYSLTKVKDIAIGPELIKIELEVRSKLTNEVKYIEQIVNNSNLNSQGVGVLLFTSNNKVEYVGLENKNNILGTNKQLRPISMYFPDFSSSKLLPLPAKIQKEIDSTFGKKLSVSKFVDLGQIKIAPMFSPDELSMFAVIFETDTVEPKSTEYLKLIEVNSLDEVIKETRDPLLLSILSKLTSFAII